jgi:hypothetical protein
MSEPLPIMVRLDPKAGRGDLVASIAALLLERARRALADRPPPETRTGGLPKPPVA